MSQNNLLIIGHRGAMGHETENSLASIKKAMELNVDMIEIDVFKIKSGELVVFHDEKMDRLTNVQGNIEDFELDSLKQVTLIGGHQIPTLDEVLDLMDNKVALNVELKGSNTAEGVNAIIQSSVNNQNWDLENFVISSFKWDELRTMRQLNTEISIAVLTEDDDISEAISTAIELNAVAVNPWFKTLNREKVEKIHKEGLKVYTYTVNEPIDIERMRSIGVDGIFINYPERAL